MHLLSNNNRLSRKDLALLLNVTEGSIRHHLNKLQEEGILVHVGPDKGGATGTSKMNKPLLFCLVLMRQKNCQKDL